MSFRSHASLRVAVSLAALLVLSACTDYRPVQLSEVQTIDIPEGDPGAQANQNIDNPTLEIPVTYSVKDGDELTLVWQEEFNDGPDIDPETWFFATGDGSEKGLPGGWGNNELQYYLPDNAMIVNGVLEITARRETVGDLNYTSARINTEDRFAFKYGRIEASIKLPPGQGLWPAFWMLSQSEDLSKNSDYTCGGVECIWAATGEIDIMEAVNLDGTGANEIYGTIHYGGEAPANISSGTRFTPSVDVTEGFHTYALEWDEDEIRWYFDGELYLTKVESSWFSTADNGGPGAPFNQPFHILLNLAVGGNFPGPPNGITPFPATMEVDWVRVYSGEGPPADSGAVPENGVFVTDPNGDATLAPPGGLNDIGSGANGSGAMFNEFYALDPDFKPALQVTSGDALGGDHVGFVAFVGYEDGFAANYETFSFKVKGLPGDQLEVKFFGSPDMSLIINLSTYTGVTDLGNDWYQVTIPMSEFAENIYAHSGFQIGPPGDQAAEFSFLLTDIGFNGTIVTAPADPGTTPDVSLYARGGIPDLIRDDDYAEVTPFGSGADRNENNTGDPDFSPALSVTTGFGYDKWNAQLAYVGFDPGFAASYETLEFKVKGMSGDMIRVKLLNDPNPDYVDIMLASSGYATLLGNGWYQVAVPIADFPGDVATATGLLFETIDPAPEAAFTFLLNDIGFSGMVEMADPGTTPEFVLFGTTAAADVAIPENGPTNFGSGASFDFAFTDSSFDPVIAVTAGNAYGPADNWVAFLAVTGYGSPIADGYDTFNVKVKGSPLGNLEVKLIGGGADSIATVVLADYAGATDLGDGWYDVSIPFSEFSNPEIIPLHTGWLIGPPGDQADAVFTVLLTDVGFSNAGGGTADAGTTPEFVLFGTTAAADVAIPENGPTNFGSGASFDFAFTDSSFDPVIAVTAGNAYGPADNWVAFLAVTGYGSPIADGYDTFNVKVKGSPLGNLEVKLIGGGADSIATVVLADYAGATDLGDGWYDVSIPFSEFSNPEIIPLHTGWLIGPPGDQADAVFTVLLTDVGFSNAGGGTADAGTTPEFVLFGTTAAADVAIPENGPTNFGSGASFDFAFTDSSFDPVIAVTAGNAYGPADNWVAFLAVTGYGSPIADGYDTFNVKVKGSPLGNLEVKLIGGGADSIATVVLADYAGATDLGDGWYDVSIPFSEFSNPEIIPLHTGWLIGPPGDQADAVFTVLLTDVGFSNAGGGTADAGTTPEFVLFGTTAAADVAIPENGPTNFGSGASFDFAFTDSSFDPVIAVTAGNAYGPADNWVAFLAVTGYGSPIADGYDTFNVKVKGSPLGNLEVKLIGGGADSIATVVLADYAGATDLGDGWYDVSIPFSEFSNPEIIPLHTGWLIGPPGDQADAVFTVLLTDVGFSNAGGGTADAGTTPEFVLFGTTAAADVAIPENGPTNFGSGASFDFAFTDSSFDPVIAVTAGNAYGPADNWVAFLAVTGYGSPIADGYDTFNVKVKGSPLGNLEVKLIGGGADSIATVVLADYAGATDLGDGWYDVSIPFSEFSNPEIIPLHTGWLIGPPGDQADAVFTVLLTDVGFSNAGGGTADAGTTPEFVLFGTTAAADVAIPENGPTNFGSGASFDFAFTDSSFDPVIAVTAGNAYGPADNWVAFLAVTGYGSPIADGYDTFNVKVKGSPLGNLEVKLIGGGADSIATVVLADYAGATDLGDGWYDVSIPFSEFSNPEITPLHTGWLIGPPGDQADAVFTVLLTDVGFSNAGGGTGGTGAATGELVLNGDFEDGLNGWVIFDGSNSGQGGTISVGAPNSTFTVGSSSARIYSVGGGQFPLLKLERLSEGVLADDASVTVSFDWYNPIQTVDSNAGPIVGNNVVIVQLLTERTGDNGASTEDLIAPPTFLVAGPNWQQATFNTSLGPDAGGGVSLFFQTNTGGNADAEMDLYIDNVSIVIN